MRNCNLKVVAPAWAVRRRDLRHVLGLAESFANFSAKVEWRAQRAKFREIPAGRAAGPALTSNLTLGGSACNQISKSQGHKSHFASFSRSGLSRRLLAMLRRIALAAPSLVHLRPALGRALPPAMAASVGGAIEVRMRERLRRCVSAIS